MTTVPLSKSSLLKLFKVNFLKKDELNCSSLEITNTKIIKFNETYRLLVSRNNGTLEHWEYDMEIHQWLNLSIINSENINDASSSNTIEDFLYFIDPTSNLERVFTINGNEIITEYDLQNRCIKKQHMINVSSDVNCIIWSININKELNKIIIGLTNNNIQIYDIPSDSSNELIYNSQLVSSINNDEKILTISFIDDDKHILTGTSLGKIKILSYENKNSIQVIKTLKIDNKKTVNNKNKNNKKKFKKDDKVPIVWCLEYIQKYNVIVSGDSNGDLKVWDFKSSTLLQSLSISSSSTSNGGNTNKSKNDILNLIYNETNDCIFTTSLDKKISMFKILKSNNDESFKVHLLTSRLVNKSTTNILQGYDLRALHSVDDFMVIGNDKGMVQIFNQCSQFNTLDNNTTTSKLPILLRQEDTFVNNKVVFNLTNDSLIKMYTLEGKILSKMKINPIDSFTVNKSNEIMVLFDKESTTIRSVFLEHVTNDDILEGIKVTKLPLENLPFSDNNGSRNKKDSLRIQNIQFINENEILILYKFNTFDFNGNVTNNNLLYKYNIEEMEYVKIEISGFFNEEEDDEDAEEELANILIESVEILPENKLLITSEYKIIVLHPAENTYKLESFYELKNSKIQICRYHKKSDTLIIVTKNFKILQLNLKDGSQTQWSMMNYGSFPKIVVNDMHKSSVISDIVSLPNSDKLLFYANNWILIINLMKNLPMKAKKRKYNEILDTSDDLEHPEVQNADSFVLITKFSNLYKLGLVDDKENEVYVINDYLHVPGSANTNKVLSSSPASGKYSF
ncbi:U3 small nucleolar RNA-associated protein 4 [Hanseniaspora uvarum DSM 2768]|nr:U3 small nucleolar RNA-associated protein 4 [Hanseniaspora uvarum DSM 2768]